MVSKLDVKSADSFLPSKLCMRSQMAPFRFIFEFFVSGLKRKVLVQWKLCALWRTLLSEAGLRRFSGPRIGSGASCFFVARLGGLIVCRLFAALRWLLEVFLAVAEFVGFAQASPFKQLFWILYCPLLAFFASLHSTKVFSPENESWSFQSIRNLLIV